MPLRVIALFLASVLLWSGLSTIEAPREFAPPSPEQQHAAPSVGGLASVAREGSVEHHHLDDLPLQALSDPPAETPGLLPVSLLPAAQPPGLTLPRRFVSAAVGSPFLDGPLRPPC